ncbi:MAG: hypothetical protein N3D10_03595 [Candidatus Micrarchaeota archaeon]|nr:hypothetical protein [Candidatus Micrarchaeota archaeon]
MVEAIGEFVNNLNMLTNMLLAIVMLVSIAMIAYPDPTVRHNGIIAFLATIVAAIATNLPINVI